MSAESIGKNAQLQAHPSTSFQPPVTNIDLVPSDDCVRESGVDCGDGCVRSICGVDCIISVDRTIGAELVLEMHHGGVLARGVV